LSVNGIRDGWSKSITHNEYLVRSTWYSVEDWKKWLHSKEKGDVNDQIDQLSREKAEYAIYEPLVGGIIPALNIQGEK